MQNFFCMFVLSFAAILFDTFAKLANTLRSNKSKTNKQTNILTNIISEDYLDPPEKKKLKLYLVEY